MLVITYSIYLLASVLLTVYVGQTLHSNGRYLVIDCLRGDVRLADSVNHLLLVGYYLINIAFVVLLLKSEMVVETSVEAIHMLSSRIGFVSMTLGIMHFINVFALLYAKRKRDARKSLLRP